MAFSSRLSVNFGWSFVKPLVLIALVFDMGSAAAAASDSLADPLAVLEIYTATPPDDKVALLNVLGNLKQSAKFHHNDSLLVFAQLKLADVLQDLGFYEEASKELYETKPHLNVARFPHFLAKALIIEAQLMSKTNEPEQAIALAHQALASYQVLGDSAGMGHAFNELAINTAYFGQFDSAMIYLDIAAVIFERLGNKAMVASLGNNRAVLLIMRGNTEQALQSVLDNLEQKEKLGPNASLAATQINAAGLYLMLGQPKNALVYLEQAEKLVLKENERTQLITLYNSRYKALKQLGRHEQALRWLERTSELKDSLLNQDKQRSMMALRQLYDTQSKDQRIKNQAQALELKDTELLHTAMQRKWLMGTTLGALAIMVVLALGYLKITVINRELKAKRISLTEKNDHLEQLNGQISQQKDELARLNKLNTQTFSILAHDLRQPLGTLKALSQNLSDDPSSPQKALGQLSNFQQTLDATLQLVDNLLNWSTAQSGLLKLETKPVNVTKLVDTLIEDLLTSASLNQVVLVNKLPRDFMVQADEYLLPHVFRNLMANAIAYAGQRSIVAVSADLADGLATLEVIDNGQGVPAEELANLFTVNEALHKTRKGAGLGLTLCKEFVQMMNGRIWADLNTEGGLAVRFTLKAAA